MIKNIPTNYAQDASRDLHSIVIKLTEERDELRQVLRDSLVSMGNALITLYGPTEDPRNATLAAMELTAMRALIAEALGDPPHHEP